MLGAFCAQDLALFVAFFDLMLIPFYFLTGIWGTGDRVRATTKLVIYTLVGSFFMLAGGDRDRRAGRLPARHTDLNFAFSALQQLPLSHASQDWIFLCFAVAFLVKMPLVPFHGWLADGYKSMPIPAVAVFSAILSKVAAYGFLRIVLPLFPYASAHFQTLMLLIALVSILWATALAFTTPDARLVVAYSSVAQLAFITLGIFSLRPEGAQGALLQMVNHALVTAPRSSSSPRWPRASAAPRSCATWAGWRSARRCWPSLFLIVTLAWLAMPGSSNFVGRVHDPARRVQVQARDLGDRVRRSGRCCRLRAAAVHLVDAQPSWSQRELPRDRDRRRGRDRPVRSRDPGARVLPAVPAQAEP